MRALLAVSLIIVLTANGQAQAPSPAQLGIDTGTPQVLSVLDKTKTWVVMGIVDPITHTFTPAGGGGGGGGIPEAPMDGQQYGRQSGTWTVISSVGPPTGNCNQLDFSVACNSQYLGAGVP